jgi:NAD(P)-dependent dehydrogenase (short-subunit alcohol dehydrogenase family)
MKRLGAALVTGGSRRIGAAIAEALAREGYAVGVHASPRSIKAAEALISNLRSAGGEAAVVAADLAAPDSGATLMRAARDALGPVTLLVNNASLFESDALRDLDPDLFDRHMAVNLRAPVFLSRAFAALLPPGRGGAIVNVIDQRVWRLTADFFSYTLSKAALWTATQTMALALAPHIRVNAVGPGPTLPNHLEGEGGFAEEVAAAPLRRAVSPQAIAEAVLYLARAESVTGQMIAVDAGQHLA